MYVLENVPLSGFSTMRLGGPARFLTEIANRSEIAPAIAWAEQNNLPVIMIGSGSNIVWKDEGFAGLVLVNKIPGFEVISEVAENIYITVGAGENWDSVVKRTVESDLSGIEQLSLIPGTSGATPIQNVGAYGREISEVIISVEAYDNQTKQLVNIPGSDCQFSYRMSRFKSTDKGRFFISSITLNLLKTPPQPPFYSAVEEHLKGHGITNVTGQALRDAVITIRSSKLPDPAVVANNGSFFYNPIIPNDKLISLRDRYPGIPHWAQDDGRAKISAAWLIEQTGFKDIHDAETGMATWPRQPLVLVNEKASQTAQLLAFKQKIVDAVNEKFGIVLEQEPELLPS